MRLTELKIEKLTTPAGQKDRLVFDEIQRGLAVRVTSGGGKTYLVQYTLSGRKHRFPIGSCSAISLAHAREAAAARMGDVAKGGNPAAERRQALATAKAQTARQECTLGALIHSWAERHLSHKRPKYAREATRALRYAFTKELSRPAEDLSAEDVIRALDDLTARKAGMSPASCAGHAIHRNTVRYGRALFSWAKKMRFVKANPFEDIPTAAPVARDRVLSDAEIKAIWLAAGNIGFPYGLIIRMLMLTGQRLEEVAGMKWSELSDDLSTWSKPGARNKNHAFHIVPLSDASQRLIRSMVPEDASEAERALAAGRRANPLVFPGRKGDKPFSGWSHAKGRLDARCGVFGWTQHDIRRSAATGLQALGVRLEVTEAILNHVGGRRSGIVGVYQRHEWAKEKRLALDAWGARLTELVSDAPAGSNLLRATFAVIAEPATPAHAA